MFIGVVGLFVFCLATVANAKGLPDTVAKVKPSIVGIGTYLPTRGAQSQLHGTGFFDYFVGC
jgi:serine protease Do